MNNAANPPSADELLLPRLSDDAAQYRFNRRYDLKVILIRLLRAAALTGPRPERVIRAAELGG